jgi:hypothetical protein
VQSGLTSEKRTVDATGVEPTGVTVGVCVAVLAGVGVKVFVGVAVGPPGVGVFVGVFVGVAVGPPGVQVGV